MTETTPLQPEPNAPTRIASLDFVRGVAVLGILVANIVAFGQPMAAYSWPGAFLTNPGHYGPELWGLQLVLVDGKFRGLFSLLFGAGMELFFRKAAARGNGHALLARRLAWLGVFGLAHWAFLWRGDILLVYAAAGLLLISRIGKPWQGQLVLGGILYAVCAVFSYASSVPLAQTAQGTFPAGSTLAKAAAALGEVQRADLVDAARESELVIAGDQAGSVGHRMTDHLRALPGDTLISVVEALPLMLIGMGMLGMGLFDGRVPRRTLAEAGALLWTAGTAASVPVALWAMRGGLTYWDTFAALNGWMVVPHFLSALGLCALLSALGQGKGGRGQRLLEDAGRCAFTNYLGTSVMAITVFSGWGLGLFGKLDRLSLYGVVVALWAVMLVWPQLWLARFRHGPLEWLWRCLTYGRVLPLRK